MSDFYPGAAAEGVELLGEPFFPDKKNGSTTELQMGRVVDRELFLESPALARFVSTYRDIFGHAAPVDEKSWGEYLRCRAIRCAGRRSIEDVFGLDKYRQLGELETDSTEFPDCPECGSEMEFFYPPEQVAARIATEFREPGLEAAFAFDRGGVPFGFTYHWEDTLPGVWKKRLAEVFRGSKLDLPNLLEQVERNTGGEIREDSRLIYGAETGAILPARGWGLYIETMRLTLEPVVAADSDARVLFFTQKSSGSYPLFRAAGARVVGETDDHPVKILTGPAEKLHATFCGGIEVVKKRLRQRIAALGEFQK